MDSCYRFQPRIGSCWDTLEEDAHLLLSQCIERDPYLTASPEYRLFYCIQEDAKLNMYLFAHTAIEEDPLVYPGIRRNTRHALESYVDLFNLVADSTEGYLAYLKQVSGTDSQKNESIEAAAAFMKKMGLSAAKYSFSAKMNVFRRLSADWNREQNRTGWPPAWWEAGKDFIEYDLYRAFKECSGYSHPDLFTKVAMEDRTVEIHEKAAQKLLRQNLAYYRKGIYLIYAKAERNGAAGDDTEEAMELAEQSFEALTPWAEGLAPILMEEVL